METASEKVERIERIHQLWKELERMKPNTSEAEALMEKNRALSAEYQALIDAPQRLKASK
jgi:DNA repair ATPase RecN